MSLNGKTGALIGLSIAVSILFAFSVTITFNWYNTTIYNQRLEEKLEEKEKQIENQTKQQLIESQNITRLLADYEENKVTTSLQAALDAYTDESDLKDLCSVWGTKESNSNLTKIWQNTWDAECLVQQPTPSPQPTPTPVPVPPKPPAPAPTPVPPTPECDADEVYNSTTNECVAKPAPVPPTPLPTPTGSIKVAVVGDIDSTSAGTNVYNQIKKQNPNEVIILGDLGYDDDLKWFKSTYGTLGDKLWCVIGNHEADNEDGSASIEKETKEFCGNSYWIKRGAAMFFMINTNDDDIKTLITKTGSLLSNQTFMQGIKTLHVFSHKPCVVPPNSHHSVEQDVKAICEAIKFKAPAGVKVFYTQAHNHVMSESNDKSYKQVGSGGRSHYTCGTSTEFPFCDNKHYGFLMYTIRLSDGMTSSQFIDYNGVVVR